jgi:hypothetical protein
MAQRDFEHLVGRRHLQGQWQVERLHQPHQIIVGNMTPVFAQVRNDAVGAGLRRRKRSAHWIGMAATARISDCRDVIDIHPKPQFSTHDETPSGTGACNCADFSIDGN